MKKVIKVAGYQGEASVHTRSMDFFINELSKTFDFEYEKDITLLGKKASSLIDMTRNNDIQISYLWSSYYEKLLPEIQLLDLPFYFKNKNEVKTLIDDKFNLSVINKLSLQIIPILYLIISQNLILNELGDYNYFQLRSIFFILRCGVSGWSHS